MLNLAIETKNLDNFQNNPIQPKKKDTVKEKDFAQVLEKEKIKSENKAVSDGKEVTSSMKNIVKINHSDEEEFVEDTLLESPMDEDNYLINLLHGLALNLDLLTNDYDKTKVGVIEDMLQEIADVIAEIDLSENVIVPFESYEELIEVTNALDDLILYARNKNLIEDGIIPEELVEMESNLDSIKAMIEEIGSKFKNEDKQIEEHLLEIEDDSSLTLPKENRTENTSLLEPKQDSKTNIKKAENDPEVVIADNEEIDEEDVEFKIPYQIEDKVMTRTVPRQDVKEFEAIDKKQVFDQIIEKARLIVDENKQEIRIKLKPDVLGELVLKMEIEDKAILAKIMVDNYRTKELIETNLFLLKEEMRENGLEIKTFEVFVGTNEDFQKDFKREFYFNQKPSKVKIRNSGSNELKKYEEKVFRKNQVDYHEGQLNLLA